MEMEKRLRSLEEYAMESGFSFERDETTVIIGKSGFRYMFKTNVSDTQLAELIEDSCSFIRDLLRMENEKN